MITRQLLMAVCGVAIGCSLLYGYNIGVLNNINDEIRSQYCYELQCFGPVPASPPSAPTAAPRVAGESTTSPLLSSWLASASDMSTSGAGAGAGAGVDASPEVTKMKDTMNKKFSLINTIYNSIWLVFGCIAAFSSGIFARRFGRRGCLLLNQIPLVVGALVGLAAGWATSCWMLLALLLVHRALIGISNGIVLGVASLYLTEVAPVAHRGLIGACHQLFITIGILLGQVLTTEYLFGTYGASHTEHHAPAKGFPSWKWHWALGFNLVPALLALPLMYLSVESPRFLYLERPNIDEDQKKKETLEALKRLRGNDEEADKEFEEMRKEKSSSNKESSSASGVGFVDLFKSQYLMATLLAVGLQMAQQLTGINAIMFYSGKMFEKAQVPEHHIQYAVCATGLINVIVTVIAVPLVDRLGRRPLLLFPMGLMGVSLMGAFVTILLVSLKVWLSVLPYLAIVFILLFIIGFGPGLGNLTALLPAELYRQEARSTGMALAQGVQWASNLTLSLTFLYLNELIEAYVFLIFLVVLVAFLLFFAVKLPETKGKTCDEIADKLALGARRTGASNNCDVELGAVGEHSAPAPPTDAASDALLGDKQATNELNEVKA